METNKKHSLQQGNETGRSLTTSLKSWRQDFAECPVTVANSPVQVVAMGGASLSTMGTFEGVKVGLLAFGDMFTAIVSYLDLNWNSPIDKIRELSKMAYAEYYWFTTAEIKHFSLKVKSGHYQSNKNLSAADLYRFLSDYASELLFERAQQHGVKKPQQKNKPDPDIKKVPQIEALLRENRQAYDKGLLTHEQYKHNYNVLIAEREHNLTKMATDEQVKEVFETFIKSFTDKKTQEAEHERQRQADRAKAEQERLERIAELDKQNEEKALQIQKEANERNKKLNEMMYKFTGIDSFKKNADATTDLRITHQPDQQGEND